MTTSDFHIRSATENDAGTILSLIKDLADYERLTHEVVATENDIRRSLFGEHPFAEALIGEHEKIPICFALFFYNFSTFVGKPGIYLEDLYVKPQYRSRGFGR
jgi:GNAT superfamily N-acetyltransferase